MTRCDKCINQHKRNICKICDDWDCYEEKAMTNYDRIVRMSIEEMVKFIGAIRCNTLFVECGYPACGSMEGKYCMGVKRSTDVDILAWLQEVRVD